MSDKQLSPRLLRGVANGDRVQKLQKVVVKNCLIVAYSKPMKNFLSIKGQFYDRKSTKLLLLLAKQQKEKKWKK
ncbi:MAG: hypothetical protein MJZ28_04810 [Paludibacteraceae bacterium]|nr:hypothetical protein [Paludibacteraceae bacterium]